MKSLITLRSVVRRSSVANSHHHTDYASQRKDRLKHVIQDYLKDEEVSSRQLYEEMLSCINDVDEDPSPYHLIPSRY